ncbi:hypothetical protein BDQ17DRAFT_1419450 [Cyathus striatus]|nr:hypothetical protein BDQ17DRAFT_1419450 [Cyathus striatus]
MPSFFQREQLVDDVIYEILSALPVKDVMRIRRACKRLCDASQQRPVLANLYRYSKLLLPKGPLENQTSKELEHLLVRASIICCKWLAELEPIVPYHDTLPIELPMNGFCVDIALGRYILVAEADAFKCYDLQSDHVDIPITSQPLDETDRNSKPYFMGHQANAEKKGDHNIWVALGFYTQIVIMKLCVYPLQPEIRFVRHLSSEDIVAIKIEEDYIILYKIITPGSPMDEEIHYLPNGQVFKISVHDSLPQQGTSLKFREYFVIGSFIILAFILGSQLRVDVYPIPENPIVLEDPIRLDQSDSVMHPYAQDVARFTVIKHGSQYKQSSHASSSLSGLHMLFLTFSYTDHDRYTWVPTKTSLSLYDISIAQNGKVAFKKKGSLNVDMGFGMTDFISTSNEHMCLAVSHLTSGIVLAYHIQHFEDKESNISIKELHLPGQSRRLLSFDGIRGRLCVLHGWSRIDVMDFAS